MRPLSDLVLVRRRLPKEQAGLVVIPEIAREDAPQWGVVVAVGPGRRRGDGTREPTEVKPGDEVYLPHWRGTEVEVGGERHLLISESDIPGVAVREEIVG